MRVHDLLHYGLDNAIPTKDLVQILGLHSDRELRKMVEQERAAGAVILSDCRRGGYYLSDDPEELLRFTRTLHSRAKNTAKAAQSAQMALDAAVGQTSIEGWYDG